MKLFLITILTILGVGSVYAQNEAFDDPIYGSPKAKGIEKSEAVDSLPQKKESNIIYVEVPKKLNIKDKIFLVNRSQTTILQAVVVLMSGESYTTIGNASLVNPGSSFEMASYSGNWLKKLKGQTIGIKIKGVKKVIGDTSTTGVAGGSFATGGFGVGVQHREIKADELNNIDPELITYDYSVRLAEENHDLYIIVTSGSGAFDF